MGESPIEQLAFMERLGHFIFQNSFNLQVELPSYSSLL